MTITSTNPRTILPDSLAPKTADRAAMYVERDPRRLREITRGIPVAAPALVLPGFDREGRRSGFDIVQPVVPHVFPDGRRAKYVQPKGLPTRPYFPPFK